MHDRIRNKKGICGGGILPTMLKSTVQVSYGGHRLTAETLVSQLE